MGLSVRLRASLFASALLLAGIPCPAQEPVPPAALKTAHEVRMLSPEVAAKGVPVEVEGTVTMLDPARTIFFQDPTGGTFSKFLKDGPEVRPGQRIRVTGKTYPGLYVPGIEPTKMEVLGEGELPTAVPVNFEQLAAGERN
jgi:hypothetical protein